MIDNTINDAKTIAGGGKDVILAGRYHILRQLGEGGMGSVWLAEDSQLDNRKVAIKMLPTIVVKDKRAYQQLKSEALVSLKLVHPNIVTLRAFEENNGAPFLVMDYIEGQTLSDYLAVKGKLSEKDTVALLKPIAAALDYAHSEKIIHRDVKPSNIIIRKDGHPFILDFGIAREIQESMTRVTGRTISGTLLYMSPEQLRGAPPAPAQDVYSFAAMAYECLKGEPPFTRGEIAYQILNEKPMSLMGEVQLVTAVMTGLAKKPENRPKNCAAVLGLQDYFGHDVCKSDRSRKILWAAGVVLSVIGVTLLCWGVFAYNKGKYTKQFLALFKAEKYDPAAQIVDKIDVSDVHVQFAIGKMFLNGTGFPKDGANAARWLLKAAEQGHVDSQALLGGMYCYGSGVEKDNRVAVNWLGKAAKQGHVLAQCALGLMYQLGDGVEKDETEASKWYRKAAEQGDPSAQRHLGVMYEDGHGVEKDETEAFKWYRKAAEQGDSWAQWRLGMMYEDGNVVAKNEAEAVRWYRKAAEQGHPDAQNELGDCYMDGNGVVKDEKAAVDWYRKAAVQGNADAQCNLGHCYEFGRGAKKDEEEAVRWYRRAAEQNQSAAQCNLGYCYKVGRGVGKDLEEAVKWFRKAAGQGYARAQCALGFYYEDTDTSEAIRWYRKAADQGYDGAQYVLGLYYQEGRRGQPKDIVKARFWYNKAAVQGHDGAQYELGCMYEYGLGGDKDEMEALRWYRKAAKQGNKEAQGVLRKKGLGW